MGPDGRVLLTDAEVQVKVDRLRKTRWSGAECSRSPTTRCRTASADHAADAATIPVEPKCGFLSR